MLIFRASACPMSLIIVKASIARFVKKLAVLVGLDPTKHARRSLRAGYARAAAIARAAAAQLLAATFSAEFITHMTKSRGLSLRE
jgi:hypothetical protein